MIHIEYHCSFNSVKKGYVFQNSALCQCHDPFALSLGRTLRLKGMRVVSTIKKL